MRVKARRNRNYWTSSAKSASSRDLGPRASEKGKKRNWQKGKRIQPRVGRKGRNSHTKGRVSVFKSGSLEKKSSFKTTWERRANDLQRGATHRAKIRYSCAHRSGESVLKIMQEEYWRRGEGRHSKDERGGGFHRRSKINDLLNKEGEISERGRQTTLERKVKGHLNTC